MPKTKNIIIFLVIAIILILIYAFFIKSSPDTDTLISSPSSPLTLASDITSTTGISDENSLVAQDLLTLLLNVTNIKLNDAIFSDMAFNSLHDSSITLIPDGNEGRPNPFAPIGNDIIASVVNITDTSNTPNADITTPVKP